MRFQTHESRLVGCFFCVGTFTSSQSRSFTVRIHKILSEKFSPQFQSLELRWLVRVACSMADATLQKMLELLGPETTPEVRGAAALVLGEVSVRDGRLEQALCPLLDDEDAGVRLRAMKSIGKLRIDKALPRLLERVSAGGEEAETAAHTAAQLGARGIRALQELMPQTAPGLRRRIASALADTDTVGAETAALDALRPDPSFPKSPVSASSIARR